ncbi:MAG: BlaI/MecI/CopY family transcriptional regulator [Calditrichaeota bacterium]|nr:MAG: BlaI/MecI/CopY family transcriptional regulator [Calditrichota bacterium]
MFRKKTQLSSLEWEVMHTIWQAEKPVTVREVLERAYPEGGKAYTTIQTVMNHLVEKGFLKREKIGLVNFYEPLKSREETLEKELQNFARVTFGGSMTALANFLIDSDALSPEEIQQLKQLIEAKMGKEPSQ